MDKIFKAHSDLRRYVLWRDVRRVIGFLLWVGIWLGGALSYNANHKTYPDYRRMVGWRLWLWLALAAATGFFLFRLWKFFTDRTFEGTIQQAGLSRSYSASSDPGDGMEYDFRLNTYLKIRTDSGKLRRIRFEQKRGFYQYYGEGNRVLHLHGLPYPLNLDREQTHGCVCSACGMWVERYQPQCDACHHSLIDPNEILDTDN
jgi:hypothetical protein